MDLIKQIKEAADKRKTFSDLHVDEQSSLTAMALKIKEKEKGIEDLKQDLKKAEADLRYYRDELFPARMEEAGVIDFRLRETNEQVVLTRDMKVNVLKDNRPALHQWLRDNGHSALIKNVVSASFEAGQDEKALEFLEEGRSKNLSMSQQESVHSQTFMKWVRAQISANEPLPDVVEPYHFYKVSIK